ncbi:MAG: UbiX family flavin prenyltransferase [Candidatus Altiarchaeota archaeon]
MKVIVAVTGASGVVIGVRLVEELGKGGHEAHVIVSDGARQVAKYEGVRSLDKMDEVASHVYDENDLAASIASSSNLVDAMVVAPCSMKTLSAIANGYADNLIVRAAENALKMNWPLVVVPRDTPLSLAAIENMQKLKKAGAIILPPAVAYYPKPKTIDDVTDFLVGKILDTLKIKHNLYRKWK